MKNLALVCGECFSEATHSSVCPSCGNSIAESGRDRRALPVGTVIAGKYRIGRVLGSGGFGITYLAQDIALNRRIALKEFVPNGLASRSSDGTTIQCHSHEDEEPFERGLNRFFREGQLMAKFDHPNIVRVLDVLQANGTAYLAMEYLEGMTLKALLANKGRFPEHEALDVMTFVFDALKIVHKQNVIHRDIKPDNIYVTNQKRILLLDFGGAKQLTGTGDRSMDAMFAHGYAAQEQYSGHTENMGPWTDVYACAATIYKLMTGSTPRSALDRLANDGGLNWDGVTVSEKVRAAVAKAFALRHQDRFASIDDFQRALSDGFQEVKPKLPTGTELGAEAKRFPFTKLAIAGGIVAALAGGGWVALSADQASMTQQRIRNAIAMEGLRDQISKFHHQYSRFPQALSELGDNVFTPDTEIKDLKIIAGELDVVLAVKGVEGKRLQLRPTKVLNDRVEFECWSLDLPEKYVPKDVCKMR